MVLAQGSPDSTLDSSGAKDRKSPGPGLLCVSKNLLRLEKQVSSGKDQSLGSQSALAVNTHKNDNLVGRYEHGRLCKSASSRVPGTLGVPSRPGTSRQGAAARLPPWALVCPCARHLGTRGRLQSAGDAKLQSGPLLRVLRGPWTPPGGLTSRTRLRLPDAASEDTAASRPLPGCAHGPATSVSVHVAPDP